MNNPKSAVSCPGFQTFGQNNLPFTQDLVTHISKPDYDALVKASALPESEESQSFLLPAKDNPIVPPKYFRAEWGLSGLCATPCTWCGLADDFGHPKTPDHFWMATYRAVVKPISFDGVYVIDGSAFGKAREALFSRCFNGGNGRQATEEEIGELYLNQAKTLIPLADYQDNFTTPVVVIFRALAYGEILPLSLQATTRPR